MIKFFFLLFAIVVFMGCSHTNSTNTNTPLDEEVNPAIVQLQPIIGSWTVQLMQQNADPVMGVVTFKENNTFEFFDNAGHSYSGRSNFKETQIDFRATDGSIEFHGAYQNNHLFGSWKNNSTNQSGGWNGVRQSS